VHTPCHSNVGDPLPWSLANGHLHLANVRDLEDRVLALGTLRFTGRGSGIEIEAQVVIVASF
jgi:hypothetical protein